MGVQCTAAMHQHCAAGVELVVATAPVSTPGLAHWRVLLEAQPGMAMTDMDMFAGKTGLYASGVDVGTVHHLQAAPVYVTLTVPAPFHMPSSPQVTWCCMPACGVCPAC